MMSIRVLRTFCKLSKETTNNISFIVRNFSKKKDLDDPYKFVKRKRLSKNEEPLVWKDPNFEILASSATEFPFFLPGEVGLAWFDKQTTLHTQHEFIMKQNHDKEMNDEIICSIQECPKVLRKTVYDLFTSRNFEACDLSIITISLKPNQKLMRQNKENETEKMAQIFIMAAKSICEKLRKAGYWADFINPFSGLPYVSRNRITNGGLYESDKKFRCLDFQIFEIDHCKVISNDQAGNGKRFIGSLFTTAPSLQENITQILDSKLYFIVFSNQMTFIKVKLVS
ncbi:hypothetical protein HHI36_012628 [Cryptolaemus montrouzieri]|uniref:Uncharacterized protein n=1 Tax=Cryptolaemus montrouzieri TaxID=559131 RepID=A0ABD2NES4_9CUCU